VRERGLLILVFVAVLAGIALARSLSSDSRYRATATLLYSPESADRALQVNPNASNNQSQVDPAVGLETVRQLVRTTKIKRRAERAIGPIANTTVTARKELDSNLIRLSATSRSPARATTVANAWARALVTDRAVTKKADFQDAITLVLRQLRRPGGDPAARRNLTQQIQRLRLASALQQSDVQLAQAASVPTARVSPRPVLDTLVGGLLGLTLGLIVVGIVAAFDRRLKSFDDVEGAWDSVMLAAVPPTTTQELAEGTNDPTILESFRHLQASLVFTTAEREVGAVVVTSPLPEEGKSVAALGLAQTLASSRRKVLLVDADYRNPELSRRLGLGRSRGLSDVLAGVADFEDVVHSASPTPTQDLQTSNGASTLSVLSAGSIPPNPVQLLSTERMERLLREASTAWDHVILDCAPLLPVSDTIPLVSICQNVIVASRLFHSRFDSVARARTLLDRTGSHLLGVVVAAPRRALTVEYGYGYGYGYEPLEGPPREPSAQSGAPSAAQE
jgi:non-specific protein-tyrosine kinase